MILIITLPKKDGKRNHKIEIVVRKMNHVYKKLSFGRFHIVKIIIVKNSVYIVDCTGKADKYSLTKINTVYYRI